MSITSELTAIKEDISDGVVANKVSRFAYKEQAYTNNDADGTDNYDVNQDNNIPLGTASVMKVNQTVIELGWRARASSITRMLMNHFLGRVSYNLNKANDMINSILAKLVEYLGTADGIATLDSNALVPSTQLPKSNIAQDTDTKMFTAKGAFDYTLGSVTGRSWLGKAFGYLLGAYWTKCSGTGENDTGGYNTVCFGNGIWVAGNGNSGTSVGGLWWSVDGKAWTQGSGFTSDAYMKVHYADGIWVACGRSSGAWWSVDGKTWTLGTGFPSGSNFYNVFYKNSIWVAGGGSGTGTWWSVNGKDWNQSTSGASVVLSDMDYFDGLWVVAGGTTGVWWSVDGKEWTVGTGLPTGTTVTHVRHGGSSASSAGVWVLTLGTMNDSLYRSSDGKAWLVCTSSESSFTTSGFSSLHYAQGIWVAGTYNISSTQLGSWWWSRDGNIWYMVGRVSITFYDITYSNGVWISRVSGGYVQTSFNGIDWKRSTYISTADKNAVYYAEGMWILAGADGLWWSGVEQLIERGEVA